MIAAGGALAPPALWYAKTRPQAGPAGGSAYPGLLAEERDHAVEEIADGGDDVLDLAGEGRDLVLRAGELFERNEESAKARYEHLLKLVERYKD